MENLEREKIVKILPFSSRLKELYIKHLVLEKEVERLEKFAPYSPSMAIEKIKLKKIKLKGKEEMMAIISDFKDLEVVQ